MTLFKSMKQYIDFIARRNNRTAIQYLEDGEVIKKTYHDLRDDIVACASRLQGAFGDVSGKHISLVATYDYDYIITMLAIVYSNATAVPFNIQESAAVIREELKTVDTDFVITNLNEKKIEERGLNEYPMIERNILFAEDGNIVDNIVTGSQGGFLLFTSGSTGKNKAVITNLDSLFAPFFHVACNLAINWKGFKDSGAYHGEPMSMYLMVPTYHIGGLAVFLDCLFCGIYLNCCFKPQYMYREIEKMPSDVSFALPVVLKMWAKDIKKGNAHKLGNIKLFVVGAAPIDEGTVEVFKNAKKYILNGYGMTESSGIVTLNLSFDFDRMGSVGWSFGGDRIKIKDGEVLIHLGRKFKGYYNLPGNAEFEDGWLHTGDLGHFEGKFLYLTGRKKNLIILSSGENVSPEEIENLVYKCDKVEEVMVTGDNDMITANVYAKSASHEEIKAYIKNMNESLPIYKRIKRTVFTDGPLEKTGTGKIKR